MTVFGWFWKRPAPARHAWGADCPAGSPVPGVERCAAVDCESVRLTALAEGERACVTCLEDPGGPAAAKLAALGALPGIELELLQRYPTYVFRIGHAELAIDEALGMLIRMRRGTSHRRFTPASSAER